MPWRPLSWESDLLSPINPYVDIKLDIGFPSLANRTRTLVTTL